MPASGNVIGSLSGVGQTQLGHTIMYAGQFDKVLSLLEKAIRVDPMPKNFVFDLFRHMLFTYSEDRTGSR